ncbi:MAG: hypothetical protein WKG32_09375 [Gemmatimonadaceae bacterium]
MADVTEAQFDEHALLVSQLETLYREIEKIGSKKPGEVLPHSIAKKINHLVKLMRMSVGKEPFLDAIEPLGEDDLSFPGYGEAVVVLGELRGVMARRWNSKPFRVARRARGEPLSEF